MAQVKTERTYHVILNKREFLLIGKALRGSLKPGEETQEALALQVALAKAKHDVLSQELHESQKLMDNIAAANDEES